MGYIFVAAGTFASCNLKRRSGPHMLLYRILECTHSHVGGFVEQRLSVR